MKYRVLQIIFYFSPILGEKTRGGGGMIKYEYEQNKIFYIFHSNI